jgi:hypothetical protein
MLNPLYTALALFLLPQTSYSWRSLFSETIELIDIISGSSLVPTTFELTDEGGSPEKQTDSFCMMHNLLDQNCSVLKAKAVDAFYAHQDQLLQAASSFVAAEASTIIATFPVVMLAPDDSTVELEFVLESSVDSAVQGG